MASATGRAGFAQCKLRLSAQKRGKGLQFHHAGYSTRIIPIPLHVIWKEKAGKLKGIKQNRTGGQNKSLDAPATILHLILKQKGSD